MSPEEGASTPPGRREWLAALALAVATALVLQLPYVLGALLARPGTVYAGTLMNPEDSQTYFAKMAQGYQGAWLYTIPFTPEGHQPAFLGGFYLALGHLAHWLHLSLEGIWHGARLGAGIFLFAATFAFVSHFLPARRQRWTAYLLATWGSGLGWLLFLLNRPYWLGAFPVDFKMPEAHLFFMALTFPHVAAGTGLLLCLFLLVPRFFTPGRHVAAALVAALLNLLLVIVYPFLIYLVLAVAGLFWLARSGRRRRLLWPPAVYLGLSFSLPAPLLLYYAQLLRQNPLFAAWNAQAQLPSPPWPHYLVAFGPLLALALPAWRKGRREWDLLWVWLAVAALLLYAPLAAQRRFVQGVQVPLAVLAAVGWEAFFLPAWLNSRLAQRLWQRPRYSPAGMRRFLLVLLLLFMSLSNLYLLGSVSATAGVQQLYPFFRSQAEVEGVAWLQGHGAGNGVLLSSAATGNYVAAHAGIRVVAGHWAETYQFAQKKAEVARFFGAEELDGWRQALLARYDVGYVWYGPQERALGRFDPAQAAYLRPVFRRDEVTIYAVNLP